VTPRLVASDHRLVVLEPDGSARALLNGRLQAQGYVVFATGSPAEAASVALAEPPDAVVARLLMPGISGVQLCHLLKAEAATAHVPVILLGDGYAPRGQFWAEQSGALYARSGATGELLRTIAHAIAAAPPGDGFFTMLGTVDVRDRIAAELDRRLFESMLAAEVRALAACESFGRLFDQLSQLTCRQLPYGWLALQSESGEHLGVHANPSTADVAIVAAQLALKLPTADVLQVLDEDARPLREDDKVWQADVHFGETVVGRLAMAADPSSAEANAVLQLMAGELGVPLRVATLVQATRRQARVDPLTELLNRRAFLDTMSGPEYAHRPYVVCMLDVDHFKRVNDTYGHATGDVVLRALGKVLSSRSATVGGIACRWGGEEFLLVAPGQATDGGFALGEALRAAVESLDLCTTDGNPLSISASIGVAAAGVNDTIEDVVNYADARLYEAKEGGRNQVRAA